MAQLLDSYPDAPIDYAVFRHVAEELRERKVSFERIHDKLQRVGIPAGLKYDSGVAWRALIAELHLLNVLSDSSGDFVFLDPVESFEGYDLQIDLYGRTRLYPSGSDIVVGEFDAMAKHMRDGIDWILFEVKSGVNGSYGFDRKVEALSFLPGAIYFCTVRYDDRTPHFRQFEPFHRSMYIPTTAGLTEVTEQVIGHADEYAVAR